MMEESIGPGWWALLAACLALLVAAGLHAMRRRARLLEEETRLAARIRRTGVPASAEILDTADTGKRLDNVSVTLHLRLRVMPASGMEAFETEIEAPVSPLRILDFKAGRTVDVRVDPESRRVVMDQRLR